MRLIAENLPFYFDTIYKPKRGYHIRVNLMVNTYMGSQPSEKDVMFFIFKDPSSEDSDEIVDSVHSVKIVWIDSDGGKDSIVMPAYKFANTFPSIEPVTSKKEITMCLLKDLI